MPFIPACVNSNLKVPHDALFALYTCGMMNFSLATGGVREPLGLPGRLQLYGVPPARFGRRVALRPRGPVTPTSP